MRTLLTFTPLLLLLSLTACMSLAEDITPPPGYQLAAESASSTATLLPTPTAGRLEPSEGETEPQDSGNPTAIPVEALSEGETLPEGVGNVRVQVVNGSEGDIPTNLEITLRGYDAMTEVYTQSLTLSKENTITFGEVPLPEGRLYFATLEYEHATYGSNVLTVEPGTSTLDLEITFYQPTSDVSVLQADRLHVFVDFIDEATVKIYQLYVFSNASNQVLAPAEDGEPAIEFSIPETAFNLNVEENMSLAYMKTPDGFGIINVYPDPNPYQTIFSFDLLYDKKKIDLDLPVSMNVNAVIFMAPDKGVKVKSDQLQDAGMRDFEGVSYNMYTGSSLAARDTLSLSLSGLPKESTNFVSTEANSHTSLVIGLAAFGVALITVGVYLWRRNQVTEDETLNDEWGEEAAEETVEDIMDSIITLDDQYRSGDLPEGAYRQRRAELKERLKELLGE